jgi:glucose/arabinose dehydrogenase
MVRTLGFVVVLALAPCAAAAEWPQIALEERLTGFERPVQLIHAGDGSGRLFVVEQEGRIKVISGGQVLAAPFLDIASRVSCCGERGLLGLAFPPGYAVSARFYVNYTDTAGDTVVSRFAVGSDPNRADSASEEVLLTIDQPFANHNGGQLAFGPDGYLYVGMGDGGSGGDPNNNAQNPLSLLGKLLRIDVETGDAIYRIPAGNPFAATPGYRPEIWALGLRNPWRFAFDSRTGDLFIADVGQNSYEEVNVQPAASRGGENYGWRVMEGSHCFNPDPCDPTGLVLPVVEYDHSLGCSISGGQVYRGARWPRLDGVYLYGDYCSGRIWGLRRTAGGWEHQQLADTGLAISAFGVDELGVVHAVDHSSGRLYAVTDPAVEEPERLVVPTVAHLTGAGGTQWRNDLAVLNPNGQDAALTLVFHGDGPELSVDAVLPAGSSVEWRDVLVSLLGLSGDAQAAGSLEILSDVPVVATARSYAATAAGTFGQFLPALAASSGIGPGEPGLVPQLARSAERYSNLGFVNLGAAACTLAVQLRDASGTSLGEDLIVELAPAEWRQIFDVLEAAGEQQAAWARIEVLSPEGRAWAYASIIDRLSRDPTTIPIQPAR